MSDRGPGFPPLHELVPHRPPMLLLDEVVGHDERRTTCRTAARAAPPCPGSGPVPAWAALEYMAQCIAAHAGLCARSAGHPPRVGLLIGASRVAFHRAAFRSGQALTVVAEHVWGETALGSFACRVDDADTARPLAEGTLKVFAPADLGAFLAEAGR